MKAIVGIIMLTGYVLHWGFMIKYWDNISTFHAFCDIIVVFIAPLGSLSGYVHLVLSLGII